MHQWDGHIFEALLRTDPAVRIPRDLLHALIFYTAGAAVQSIDATYIPMAEASGIWAKNLSGSLQPAERLRGPLDEFWKPWLGGSGTRDAALAALLQEAVAVSSP